MNMFMKICTLVLMIIMVSCSGKGSSDDSTVGKIGPDESHEEVVDDNESHEEVVDDNELHEKVFYDIELESLHEYLDFTFKSYFLKKDGDEIMASFVMYHPYGVEFDGFLISAVKITGFVIRDIPCPEPASSLILEETHVTFERPFDESENIKNVVEGSNTNLDEQFIYVRGSVHDSTDIDLACSPITAR